MATAREETTRLAELLRREHHALAEFLIALAAFDRDRAWGKLGYSGLFPFLTRELRLSNGAAQNRKTAAELIQRFPAIEAALRSGDLCLSSVNELAKVITPENAAEVLPRFYGKSARDAAFVAAALRPVENPPERFVVTPVRGAAVSLTTSESHGLLHTHEVAPGQLPALAAAPVAPPPDRPTIRPLDAERARMNITVPRRLLDKLAVARDALSHSHPGASEETILELGLDLIIERHRKRRGIGRTPRKDAATNERSAGTGTSAADSSVPAPPRSRRSRHVPADVWRAVWERDGGRCQWPLENGGICGSTHRLELDHVDGFALGGATTVERTRILCKAHQDVHARALYGDAHMNAFTRPKGASCSEPVASYGASRRSLPVVPLPLRVAAAVAPLVTGWAGLAAAAVGLHGGAAGAGRTDDDAGRGREGQDGQRGGEGEGLHDEAEGATRREGGARWDRRARRRPLRGRIPA